MNSQFRSDSNQNFRFLSPLLFKDRVNQLTVSAGKRGIVPLEKKKAVARNAIEGLVIPNKWDEKGRITGIAIHTSKEEVYLVAHNRMESELLNHIQVKVGIQGKIMERLDGSKLIHVSRFQPVIKEGG